MASTIRSMRSVSRSRESRWRSRLSVCSIRSNASPVMASAGVVSPDAAGSVGHLCPSRRDLVIRSSCSRRRRMSSVFMAGPRCIACASRPQSPSSEPARNAAPAVRRPPERAHPASLHAQLAQRLPIEPAGLLKVLLLLVLAERFLGLGAHHAVDRARIVALVLERLLDPPDAGGITVLGTPVPHRLAAHAAGRAAGAAAARAAHGAPAAARVAGHVPALAGGPAAVVAVVGAGAVHPAATARVAGRAAARASTGALRH